MIARLGDICTVVSGSTPKSAVAEYWDGDIKWITPAELSEDTYIISDSARHITALGVAKTGLKPFPAGTVILSSRAPIGKTAIAGCEMYCNQGFKNLICSEKVDSKYLYFFLSSKTDYLNSLGRGATFKEISKAIVENIEIPLPKIDEQKLIAACFEKLMHLIQLRKTELEELDRLVKSRFVELFGERLERETVKLSTLTEVITKGTTPTTLGFEFTESGINFVKIECLTEDCKFIISKMLHISDECNQKLKRSILQEGDVLFSIAGAIGRTAIVTKEILPANTNQAVAIIRLKKGCGLNVKFLNQMLHSSLIEKQVNVKKAGVAQINLSLADIGDFNVILPPMELQEQFAAFVEQTDKSKLAVQQGLQELEILKKSLMQQYFG